MLFEIKTKELMFTSDKPKQIDKIKPNELTMDIINDNIAIEYISTNHYSRSCTRQITIAFGFYYDDVLVACVVYAIPVGRKVVQSISDNITNYNVLELTRLFADDRLPHNTESYIISRTIKCLKQYFPDVKYLISYADSKYNHCGMIYQASNWLYCGKTDSKVVYRIDNKTIHSRTLYSRYGTSSISELKKIFNDRLEIQYSKFKYRYIYILAKSKTERNKLLNELKLKIYDKYPKSDIKYYGFK